MGSAGMVAAEFAATLNIRVAVIERDRFGGDCLWTGCVPSKALLASAKVADHMRNGERYGLPAHEPEIDTAAVWRRIRRIQDEIAASDDDPERFRELGVDVIFGEATITGPNSVEVDGSRLETRYILLCTGSRPLVPEIDGLPEAGFLTSESVFQLERAPRSVVIVGGGPIAVELAQGFSRLAVDTTVLQRADRILPRDEPDLVAILADRLRGDGVDLRLEAVSDRVTAQDGHKTVHGSERGEPASWSAEEILVAAGRRPNVEGLGLERLGIGLHAHGVAVDERGRTSVRSIYAVGDVAGRYLFTHSAGYEGVRAVRDMFFPGRGKAGGLVPWCTFTDPELAHAGLTVAEARDRYGDSVGVWRQDLVHSDRARSESASEGAVVIVTAKKRVVGAHILAPAAGEMIHELALAIRERLKLTDIASLIHVYPTVATAIGQLAAESAFASAKRYSWLVRR